MAKINCGFWAILNHRYVIFLILLSCACSCGYSLVGHGRTLPDRIKSIAVPIFLNKTSEPNLDLILSNVIREEFILDGRLQVLDETKADLVLKGEINGYSQEPISFDTVNRASEYWLHLSISMELQDQLKDELRLKQNFSSKWDYKVSQDISSTDIKRIEATKKASKILAQQLISIIIEGF